MSLKEMTVTGEVVGVSTYNKPECQLAVKSL